MKRIRLAKGCVNKSLFRSFVLLSSFCLLFLVLSSEVGANNCCCGGGAWCADCTTWCGGSGCKKHSCRGCTPDIPSGYTSVDNGCKVTITRTCKGSNGCKSCTLSATRWLIEPNVGVSIPSSLSILVDGQSYSLSTNSAVPTVIKYPSLGTMVGDVKMSIPSQVTPSTSDGLGYHFRANNYGLNDEWIAWGSCTHPRAEDFCSESTINVQNFAPSTLSILNTLKQGAKGLISGMYYTVNKCDDGKLYSLPIETYYKVNNNPNNEGGKYKPVDVCDWDPSLLASDLECVDPESGEREEICSMEEDLECTKKEFFTNVGTQDSTSLKGCNSEEYTGTEVNNPLKVRIGGVDKDGVDEIKGVVVWFSKDNNTPALPKIVDTYTSTDLDNVGIMILQKGGSWDNTPILYAINSDNTWGKIGNGELWNDQRIAKVLSPTITVGEQLVTFEFNLLLSEAAHPMSGMYNFKTVVLDKYMLLSDGRVDISHMVRHFNWGIDLVDPVVGRVTQSVNGPTETYLNLEMNGTGSNITDYVMSGYRDGGSITSGINLLFPEGYDSISLRTGEDYPQGCLPEVVEGNDCALNTWHFPNINVENYQTASNSVLVDIGQNEGGAVVIYTTAYDQACNDSIVDHVLDLRSWVATKGGVMYSQGSMGSNAKNFSEEDDPAQFFETAIGSTLRNYSIEQILKEMTTGTELISSRNEALTDLIHSVDIKAVRANNVYDSNEKKNYWFDYFKKKLDIQLLSEYINLKEFSVTGNRVTDAEGCISGDSCLMYSTDSIEIPQNYVCDTKTLIMSEKDIIITPGVTYEGSGIEGCIFLARNRIYVKEGEHLSTGGIVRYDYIDGFLVSEDQILIEQTLDINQPIRDGLEVRGGLVAFGRDSTDSTALLIQRNLRLYSYINPTLVVTWDVRYAKLSEIFFGSEAAMYKQEVGFKAF